MFQCIPNFSEGRRLEVVEALADAVRHTDGVRLIDYSADPDHNRCVLTFLGEADAVRSASLAACRVAVARIDLRIHQGVHPRAGAVDVLPVVPLRSTPRQQAIDLAHEIGADLARELALPVYFYEWAANPSQQDRLPELRKGGFERFASMPLTGEIAPDAGPGTSHPTAGIAIVGARGPLVACNIDLDTTDVELARAIARRIRLERDRRADLRGVRALGLYLSSRHRAQVSMNLTRPDATPLTAVFAFVQAEAQQLGVEIAETEVIGMIPLASLGGESPEALLWRGYKPTQIMEHWLA